MDSKKSWRVIYVKARHEKIAQSDIVKYGIETYLPMRSELHQWSDRRKWIDVPLFSGYVFVRISMLEFGMVYLANGFVKFVSLNGKPSIVPDDQVEAVKRIVDTYGRDVEVVDGNCLGMQAEITAGPLMGLRGEVIQLKNLKSFVVKVDGLEKVLSVRVPAGYVRILNPTFSNREKQVQLYSENR